METQGAPTVRVAKVSARLSRQQVQAVITLLDRAVGQLRPQEEAVQRKILEAALLLRQQLGPQIAAAPANRTGQLLAWQARKVCDFIDARIAGPLCVADLCALVERSQAHFSRSFKLTFGTAPHAFVVRRRVELAAHCMLHTDASLSDIAQRFGFADQAHLCKHFRQATGQTPGAWRRAQRSYSAGDARLLRPAPQLARARVRLTRSPAFSPEPWLRSGS